MKVTPKGSNYDQNLRVKGENELIRMIDSEYVMKAEAGILSTENMDENKVSQIGPQFRFPSLTCVWCEHQSSA